MDARTIHAVVLVFCVGCSASPAPAPGGGVGQQPIAAAEPQVDAQPAPPDVPPKPERQPMRVTRDSPLELTNYVAVELVDYVIEQTVPPDDTQAPEHGVVISLRVDGYDVSLYQSAAVGAPGAVTWVSDFRVEVAGDDPSGPWVDLHIDRIGPNRVARSERSVRVTRGQTIELGDGATMEFTGHGHKTVMAGGPSSPLLVRVTYRDATGHSEDDQASLHPPEEATWRWRDHEFVLGEYEYGDFMVLELARLALTPATLKQADAE